MAVDSVELLYCSAAQVSSDGVTNRKQTKDEMKEKMDVNCQSQKSARMLFKKSKAHSTL